MVDELIGKQFGGYEVLSRIGRGGMATVFLAIQTSMNRQVAIKVLPRDQMKDDSYLQRFEREVNVVARLEHRNIVPVYDHGTFDGQPYIVMRYMNAGSIDDVLRQGPLSPEKFLNIIEQIAPALDYAHSKNVLHRDLKPGNVLMDDDGGAYITDFGIARILGTEGQGSTITTQGVVGTPSYMSPEQAQGQPLDGRSDVYSLGVMLFEMATGRRPFQSDTPYSIAVMQVTTPPPPPRSINPKLTTAVESVIYKTMKKKAEERYQTASLMAESLRLAVERPTDFIAHDTQRPMRKPSSSLQATQPNQVSDYTVPAQPMSAQQPLSQQPLSQSYQPQPIMQQQPIPQSYQSQPPVPMPPLGQQPSSLYPPPTSTGGGSMPVRSSTGLRKQIARRRGNNMWLSILIGAMIGCGLLTMVVTGLALLVNNFINNNTTVQDSSTPDSRSETTDPEAAATEEISTPSLSGQSGLVAPLEGQLIFFADRDDKNGADDYEIYRLNLSNQDEVQLTSDDSANMNPAGSPDGQRIAFQSDRDGDFDIYSVNPMGGALMKVVQNQVDDVMPAWSPDGEWLAFASDTRDDGALDLFIVRPDGTDLRRVLTNERRNSSPRWSPDGQSLVFTTGDPTNASTWEIAILDLTTERMRKLTENDVRDTWADFSPDGASLVYITGSDGATSIARLTVDSAREPDILYEGGEGEYIWSPHYSLDGSYIIFNAGTLEDAIGHVYVMKVDEDEAGRQRLDVDKGLYASWLP